MKLGIDASFLYLAGHDHFSMVNILSEENNFTTKVNSFTGFSPLSVCMLCMYVCILCIRTYSMPLFLCIHVHVYVTVCMSFDLFVNVYMCGHIQTYVRSTHTCIYTYTYYMHLFVLCLYVLI